MIAKSPNKVILSTTASESNCWNMITDKIPQINIAKPTIAVVPYVFNSSIGCNVYTQMLAADTRPQNKAFSLKYEISSPFCMTIQIVPTKASNIQNNSGIDGFLKYRKNK